MGVYLADQTLVFLQSLLTGALLGLLFDAFRISRIALPTPAPVVFVEDLLFFLACAVVTFVLMLQTMEGQVRFFLFIGEILGAVLYFVTVGQLVMAVSKTIIRVIKSILRFFYRYFFRPIWHLVYNIVLFILRPFVFLGRIAKKTVQRCKFRLKVHRLLVYNHFMEYRRKKPKKTDDALAYEEEGKGK